MVPDTWQVMPLADICDEKISYGIVQAGPHVEDGTPYIKSSDLNSELKLDDLQRTAVEIHNKYIRSTVRPGDIIFSLRGNIGLCRIVPASIPEANLTQGTARISVKPEYSTEFFLQQITGPELNKSIQAKAKGSTFQEISLEALRKVPVLVPPKAEQTKIAQILSTWDKAIATTERLLANSQQQKQALVQQLLTGQKRFKQFADTWETYRLGDLFERITKKNTENNTNVVSISAQQGLIRQDELFKKSVASETLEGYYLLSHGQFAYNKSYSNGYPMGAIKRLNRYEKGVVTTLYICFAVRDESNFCPVFFEQFFDAGLLNEGLAQVAHEGGRAHGLLNVKPSDFFSLKVEIPSFEEQQKIAQVLSTADAEISNLQAQLATLKLEKKALMQQLLTGQRRVKPDAEAAETQIRRVG